MKQDLLYHMLKFLQNISQNFHTGRMMALIFTAVVFFFITSFHESFADEHIHDNHTSELKINQTKSFDSGFIEVKFLSVIEDSRCPSDVTCIWEGRVTGKFSLNSNKESQVIELSPNTNKRFVWHSYVLQLDNISPYPSSAKKISPEEYTATITVDKARYESPLKQAKSGAGPTKILCNSGLESIMKKHTGQIVCVKLSSIEKLLTRGWAIHILPDYQKNTNNNSEIFSEGSYTVEDKMVKYFDDIDGYLVKPVSTDKFPQIIMIHEWWGLNDNIKTMAKKLASHGYIVLAVDLYGGKVATTADQARQLVTSFDKQAGINNMNSAVSYLQKNYGDSKVGSIGWCFGGGQSLNLALNNSDMDATVIYYGQLVTESNELSKIKWPILGIFAANDQGIPVDTVNQFESKLNELHISNQVIIYPDVDHAFANPSGNSYSPDASQDAWTKTISFLNSQLK